ncbi:NUDIX hydrolase [Thiosulfatihalobacter marinus]|jgi:8-oxo-dGTP pyrophosphatase MutT (NUDIX family)|uniref:NUDIX hydrolase n=1 Tax=Thiosulfatihalobacter marinus TaxID=2792481 RepID=UPI001E2E6915|nr:NUDIX hydrolase [Thiosulfatihalobacter marinus]
MGLQNPAGIAAMAKTAEKAGRLLQYGALVYRINNDKTQVMLITSRRSQRWILPKGWPIKGLKPHQAAAQEAWEEAGIRGKVSKQPCGLYTYPKDKDLRKAASCTVILFPMELRKISNKFPESGERRRKWVSPKKAAARIANRDLARIIRDFDARLLR